MAKTIRQLQTDNYKKHTSKSKLQRFFINNFFRILLQQVRQLDGIESVLDVGCGEGFTLEMLRKQKIGKKLVGIEYLDTAIKIGKKVHPKIEFKQGTIYELPYKDKTFDLVICTEVLEHLEEPEKALKELVRVSKKYCVISVPNEPFFMSANFLRGKNFSRWGNDIEHIQHWTAIGFKRFVGKYLRVRSISLPFPWTLLITERK